MQGKTDGTAVVLGAGMAGLLAARVLAESFTRVVVVERDAVNGVMTTRRGVPHGGHAHALLARGGQILEELFPGLREGLVGRGIPDGDLSQDLRWYFLGRPLAQAPSGLRSVSAIRPVLEAHVRDRVCALDGVELRESTSIDGLVVTDDGTRVEGVRVTSPAGPEEIPAALVVDATGRGSRTPAWLEQLGHGRPAQDRVRIDLAYTTRHYRLRHDPYGTDLSINPVPSPANPRGAFFPRLDDGTSMLSLTGMLGDHPPRDEEGFLAFVRSVAAPEIYEAVRDAEPVDAPRTFTVPASIRHRYERMRSFPDGLLVVGDAVCSFNPVYGQGMTVAAMQAVALREHLASGPVRPRAFFAAIAPIVDGPWQTSVGADLAFPGVDGQRTLAVRLINAYSSLLHTAAAVDGRVTAAFFRVAGLVDPPQALMRPALVLRILRGARRVRRAEAADGRAASPRREVGAEA